MNTYQYPNKIHQSTYPEFYTTFSSNYNLYSDFKYRYSISDMNGTLATLDNNPRYDGGTGVYNSTPIINSVLDKDFNADISNITKCTNSIKEYRVYVKEYSASLSSPSSLSFSKRIIMNNYTENFDFKDYILDGNGKFLTNQTEELELTLNQRATLRVLSGKIDFYYSYFYQIYLIVTKCNGNKYYYRSNFVNPYYSETLNNTYLGQSSINDVSKILL